MVCTSGIVTHEEATASPPFEISKETTVVLTPLDADGYVDFAQVLNDRYSRGVTVDNNAASLLFQACGPDGSIERETNEWMMIARRLGMATGSEGPFFLTAKEWSQIEEDALTFQSRQLSAASEAPWKTAEFPAIDAWLSRNEKPLKLAVDASRRSKFFVPLVVDALASEAGLMAAGVPGLQRILKLTEALWVRAMKDVQIGRVGDAWQDLMACRRLAVLVSQGTTLNCLIVATRIDAHAIVGQLALLNSARLSLDQIRGFQSDLKMLPRITGSAERIDVAGRFAFLDQARSMTKGSGKADRDADAMRRYDWNAILKNGNHWFDRYVKAARTDAWDRSRKVLKALDTLLSQQPNEIDNAVVVDELLKFRKPDEKLAHNFSNKLVQLMIPNVSGCLVIERRAVMKSELARIAFALQAFRARVGNYPERLEQLCPVDLQEIPGDTFTNDKPVYRTTGAGYLLYSVGGNGDDDDGRPLGSTPFGDDLAISNAKASW